MTSASKLDLLFLVDDSSWMAPLQQKMRDRLGNFMEVLKAVPGGMPDVHVAVVSSSLGAGIFGNVPGCSPNSAGNLNGDFQHSVACTALHPGQTFISSAPSGGAMVAGTGRRALRSAHGARRPEPLCSAGGSPGQYRDGSG